MKTGAELQRPIVILGAARSGTKMLRAAIAADPRVAEVPHDINHIWKYGNYSCPHDELAPELLTPGIARFIRGYLAGFTSKGAARIVEKTVSNTLRVPFVCGVLPDCVFVHLVRDGRDVAASARSKWSEPMQWGRLFRKVRSLPLRGVGTYGWDYYLRTRLTGIARGDRSTPIWGPRFDGIEQAVGRLPLIETCGLQWKRSVDSARSGLSSLPADRRLTISYEELVRHPVQTMARVMDFVGLAMGRETEAFAQTQIVSGNIGKWRRDITETELPGLLEAIGDTLAREGYGPAGDWEWQPDTPLPNA